MSTRRRARRAILVDADVSSSRAAATRRASPSGFAASTEWDPALAGRVMLWEDKAGKPVRRRRPPARRARQADRRPQIPMDAILLREADGISAEEARTLAALKNVAEGTGSAVDAAKVVRGAGDRGALNRLAAASRPWCATPARSREAVRRGVRRCL
jgi:hypothetical protein